MTATPPSPGVSRRLPAWLRGVLIAVALVVLVPVIPLYFVDVDPYPALVSAAVKKQTGRELTLGKIRAKFLPTVGFVVDDAHLGNPPGFPQGDFLSVETLSGSLAWRPLLHKEIQINAIELVKPKVTLLTDARGRANYDFSAAGGESRGAKRGKASADSGGGRSLSLEGIGKIVLSGAAISIGQVSRRGRDET